MPSAETTVSNPRTARLDRIRSTMFGSSSTRSALVLAAGSGIDVSARRPGGSLHTAGEGGQLIVLPVIVGVAARSCTSRRLDRKADSEGRPRGHARELDPAAVGFDDSSCDGQAEAGARRT